MGHSKGWEGHLGWEEPFLATPRQRHHVKSMEFEHIGWHWKWFCRTKPVFGSLDLVFRTLNLVLKTKGRLVRGFLLDTPMSEIAHNSCGAELNVKLCALILFCLWGTRIHFSSCHIGNSKAPFSVVMQVSFVKLSRLMDGIYFSWRVMTCGMCWWCYSRNQPLAQPRLIYRDQCYTETTEQGD